MSHTAEVQVTILLKVTSADDPKQLVVDALSAEPRVYKVLDTTPKLIYSTT